MKFREATDVIRKPHVSLSTIESFLETGFNCAEIEEVEVLKTYKALSCYLKRHNYPCVVIKSGEHVYLKRKDSIGKLEDGKDK